MTLKFRAKLTNGFTVDSPLEPSTFPGGEAHVQGTERLKDYKIEYHLADLRGADSHELMQLLMFAQALDHIDPNTPQVLILPYLPGARADKVPTRGASIYADMLNSMDLAQIITLDPHSPFMPRDLVWSNLTIFPFERILKRELATHGVADTYQHPYVGVIAPDKGAVGRATRAANVLGVPVFLAEKTRDFTTGKLSGFTCEDLPSEGKLLIVDDIGDGMGTFKGLADATGLRADRLDLWVTHLILSKGEEGLRKRFGVIYTTDSFYSKGSSDLIKVIPLAPYLYGAIDV